MKSNELIDLYPDKSLLETFNDRTNALISLGASKEEIDSRKIRYNYLFEYDNLVHSLKNILSKNEEIDEYYWKKIKLHIENIKNLKNKFEQLNTGEPKNTESIFRNANDYINQNYFQSQVLLRVSNTDIQQWVTLVEQYIHEIKNIINYFDNQESILNTELLEQANVLADELINKEESIKNAINIVQNRIDTQWNAISTQLQDRAIIFENKAKKHISTSIRKNNTRFFDRPFLQSNWRWFIAWLFLWLTWLFIITKFIEDDNINSISIWSALLRISMIVVSWYFSIFCLQQFNDDRKLWEIYTFKWLALRTMDDLIKSYTDQKEREYILNKALDIVFSEPKLNEKNMVQQKYLDDMIDVIKKKI